jgi:hypothetical protein
VEATVIRAPLNSRSGSTSIAIRSTAVGNAQSGDADFIVTLVGAPIGAPTITTTRWRSSSTSSGRHGASLLYGDGRPARTWPSAKATVFLLPPHVRHSPQRPRAAWVLSSNTAGRRARVDCFEWYCLACHTRVHASKCSSEHRARSSAAVREVPRRYVSSASAGVRGVHGSVSTSTRIGSCLPRSGMKRFNRGGQAVWCRCVNAGSYLHAEDKEDCGVEGELCKASGSRMELRDLEQLFQRCRSSFHGRA